jgi:prepilin peptidase CpaA
LGVLVIAAAVFDARQRRIPNWLTLSGVLSGLALNTLLYAIPGLWMSLQGIGLALLIYFPLHALHALGAGDVKLMAAIGAFTGPADWLAVFVLTALFGGILALVVIAAQGRLLRTFRNIGLIVTSIRSGQTPWANPQLDVRSDRGTRLPHAITIACGTAGFLIAAAIWARHS